MAELEELLTVMEVAKKLKLADSSVYNFINTGVIPALKIGGAVRIDQKDLREALSKMKSKAYGEVA